MAETEGKPAAETSGLPEQHVLVRLSTGKSVLVEKWGYSKFRALRKFLGDIDNQDQVAVESVRPADRATVESASAEDVLAIAATAWKFNLGASKNVLSLVSDWELLAGDKKS